MFGIPIVICNEVKHLHAISPTGHIAHRNDSNLPHECPACTAPFETNDHVMTCPHPSRGSWRDSTTTKIMQYLPATSDPYLLDILRDGLTRFHRQVPQMNPNQYPAKYDQLLRDQNNIGWNHLYRGRWCNEWNILQGQYLQQRGGNELPGWVYPPVEVAIPA